MIAVLPLSNISGDASKDFIAAGIAESLISSLAAVPAVTVLSRASVAEARGRLKDLAALTKDLGATYLVEGSVQESGGTCASPEPGAGRSFDCVGRHRRRSVRRSSSCNRVWRLP